MQFSSGGIIVSCVAVVHVASFTLRFLACYHIWPLVRRLSMKHSLRKLHLHCHLCQHTIMIMILLFMNSAVYSHPVSFISYHVSVLTYFYLYLASKRTKYTMYLHI